MALAPAIFREYDVRGVAGRDLDDDARAMLSLVIRAVRGRARIADVMALVA